MEKGQWTPSIPNYCVFLYVDAIELHAFPTKKVILYIFIGWEDDPLDHRIGVFCNHPADDCNPDRCGSNGTCIDGLLDYTCRCDEGYYGERGGSYDEGYYGERGGSYDEGGVGCYDEGGVGLLQSGLVLS